MGNKKTTSGGEVVRQGGSTHHKSTKFSSHQQVSDTSREAYAATGQLRQTELILARRFFLEHPGRSFCRADIAEHLGKPINHTTRIIYDLLDEGFIESAGKGENPRTGIRVEYLRLKPSSDE